MDVSTAARGARVLLGWVADVLEAEAASVGDLEGAGAGAGVLYAAGLVREIAGEGDGMADTERADRLDAAVAAYRREAEAGTPSPEAVAELIAAQAALTLGRAPVTLEHDEGAPVTSGGDRVAAPRTFPHLGANL